MPGTRNTLPFYADVTAECLIHIAYIIGYMPGSVMFLSYLNSLALGAKCFVWGSCLIALGFFIQNLVFNYLNKVGGEDYINTQLDTSAFYSYIIGSIMWGIASVIYFLRLDDVDEQSGFDIFYFAAMVYSVGSCFFLLGCIFALVGMKRRLNAINEKMSLRK